MDAIAYRRSKERPRRLGRAPTGAQATTDTLLVFEGGQKGKKKAPEPLKPGELPPPIVPVFLVGGKRKRADVQN